jgi:hypothetical protein
MAQPHERESLKKHGDFFAFITERDGLGFIKGSQDSALQQLVSFYFDLKCTMIG